MYVVTCPRCGTQFDENLHKCPTCQLKNRKAVCKTCGSQISADSKVCLYCGAKRRPKMTTGKILGICVLVFVVLLIEIPLISAIFDSVSDSSGDKHESASSGSSFVSEDEPQEKTPEEERAEYIAKCETFPYMDVSRYPDSYEGRPCVISGTVIQVSESFIDLFNTRTVDLRVETQEGIWYVSYNRPEGGSRILEGDEATFYGECDGVTTYIAIMGNSVTIPKLTLKYFELSE